MMIYYSQLLACNKKLCSCVFCKVRGSFLFLFQVSYAIMKGLRERIRVNIVIPFPFIHPQNNIIQCPFPSPIYHHINLCTLSLSSPSTSHSKPLYKNTYPVTALIARNHTVSAQSLLSYPLNNPSALPPTSFSHFRTTLFPLTQSFSFFPSLFFFFDDGAGRLGDNDDHGGCGGCLDDEVESGGGGTCKRKTTQGMMK